MPDLALVARHPVVRRLWLPVVIAAAFVVFLIATFPYDTLARRLEVEARGTGNELTIGSMGPAGLLGVRLSDVRLKLAPPPGGEAIPELKFDRADLHPDLLALILRRTGFGFSVQGYGGVANGHIAMGSGREAGLKAVQLHAKHFDLKALPMRELTGAELVGSLDLDVDVSSLQPVETAKGTVQVSIDQAALVGGTASGMPLPKTVLGHVDGTATLEKGVATIEKTSTRGGDLDASVDGTVRLRPLMSLSQADLHVRFKPSEKWLGSNPMIQGAMGLLQNAKQGDGSYIFTFVGPLAHLTPRPGR